MAPPTQEATESGDDEDSAPKPLVLLADPLISEFQLALSPRYRLQPVAGADAATAASARALLTVELPAVTADLIDALPALELVVASSVGVDHNDLAACRRRGVRVTNAGDAYSTDAADYAVGLVVAALRRRRVRPARQLGGQGRIPARRQGERQARRDRGAGQHRLAGGAAAGRVRVPRRVPLPRAEAAAVPLHVLPTVRALAADSDVLVLSCALTEETRRVVDREVMEALGGGCVLVNVGRGGLVDEPELVRCLREGVIGGAGLDVYEHEPDVPAELFAMDNVVLSSHRAVATAESIRGVLDVVSGNLEAFFAGRPLLSPVAL